uniref:Origin recognition complex subunit 3 n=1 Tax=Hydatigena taeniaeformis TaxID=6205 RepID=A0A0R3XA72_HYDTA
LLASKPSSTLPISSLWKQTLEEFGKWLFEVLSPDNDSSRNLVPAPYNLPFYEVFYGPTQEAEIMALTRNLNPPLIKSIQDALCNTDCFFPIADHFDSTVLDLCVAYKIYRESSSLINVYDWLIAFDAILEPSSAPADTGPSRLIRSRFLRALLDLEQMGLVRRTKRRRDHAQKMPVMEVPVRP